MWENVKLGCGWAWQSCGERMTEGVQGNLVILSLTNVISRVIDGVASRAWARVQR